MKSHKSMRNLSKNIEDNKIIQRKDNNKNNHNDIQTCNILILVYIRWLNSFLNICIVLKILLIILVILFLLKIKIVPTYIHYVTRKLSV